ncbi:MAG: gliding motility-associated C-terminal domain-containing protein [Bacteroidetes bacterium]|nr:gliding motility-associated C-terminal domain-containing protein [Bacteroidota bacterium]
MNKKIPSLIGFTAGVLFCISVSAQNILDNKLYRVNAYKKGDHQVVSTSNYAEVIPPLSVFIPNAFTPNGDGINDTFGVKGEGIQNYTLRIFNRWGEVVFESLNPKQQWDGTVKGNPAQSDTYVYKLFAYGSESVARTGSVTLVR